MEMSLFTTCVPMQTVLEHVNERMPVRLYYCASW